MTTMLRSLQVDPAAQHLSLNRAAQVLTPFHSQISVLGEILNPGLISLISGAFALDQASDLQDTNLTVLQSLQYSFRAV
jgi:hypothetical protein